eukprot:scaffold3425_cov65-Phaeocystis_antarctica.AAC.4
MPGWRLDPHLCTRHGCGRDPRYARRGRRRDAHQHGPHVPMRVYRAAALEPRRPRHHRHPAAADSVREAKAARVLQDHASLRRGWHRTRPRRCVVERRRRGLQRQRAAGQRGHYDGGRRARRPSRRGGLSRRLGSKGKTHSEQLGGSDDGGLAKARAAGLLEERVPIQLSDVEPCKRITSRMHTHICTQGAGCRLDESESSASYTSEERRGR